MINMEILRLEINELLYHIDIFLGEDKKFNATEALKDILDSYIFASSCYNYNIVIIDLLLKDLSSIMSTDEYTILLRNTSTLTRFIKDSY